MMTAAFSISRLLLVVGAVTLAATVLTMGASAAAPPGPYANGFETAEDVDATDQAMFNVTRVATGPGGITSASGSYARRRGRRLGRIHPVRRLQQQLPGRRLHDLG